ncbi:metastasis-suppressor KiSS-1 [Anoplopoma fimbria]|uniref:Kisspeptin 1 n=1 Tax=Anoplopoma fimbria TaxID=229290 RepID=A0A0H4CQN6_ANOFI|nr:metastasis-suppressor KiSS-1 [Anoplopoma fimbria]AKN78944.1 kisspeptin 1 [Anoplopoma fimbria]
MQARLIIALMMAASSTEVYTTYNEDQKIIKALRDSSHASIPPLTKSSRNLPADEVHSADGKFPRKGWWMSKVVLPQIRKRQDVSTYNLNSFGLRYGK